MLVASANSRWNTTYVFSETYAQKLSRYSSLISIRIRLTALSRTSNLMVGVTLSRSTREHTLEAGRQFYFEELHTYAFVVPVWLSKHLHSAAIFKLLSFYFGFVVPINVS